MSNPKQVASYPFKIDTVLSKYSMQSDLISLTDPISALHENVVKLPTLAGLGQNFSTTDTKQGSDFYNSDCISFIPSNVSLSAAPASEPCLKGPSTRHSDVADFDSSEQHTSTYSTSTSSATDQKRDETNNISKPKKEKSHTPRPPNSFIIYRKEKHMEIMAQYKGGKTLNNNVISKIVANMWKQESPKVKAKYASKAEEEKRAHLLKYPDYKYRPRKGLAKNKVSNARKAQVFENAKPEVQQPSRMELPCSSDQVLMNRQSFLFENDNYKNDDMHFFKGPGYVVQTGDNMLLSQGYDMQNPYNHQESLFSYTQSWAIPPNSGIWGMEFEHKPMDPVVFEDVNLN